MSFTVKPQLDPTGLIASRTTGEQVVKGVRISCGGAKKVLKEKPYISVDLSKDGFDFLKNNPEVGCPISGISQLIGMPVYVGRYESVAAYSSSNACGIHLNPEAHFLMRGINPAKEGFGYAQYEWQLSVHNCLVVRVDGEDITPCQVEALSHFTRYHLAEAFEDVMGERMGQFNNEGEKKEKEKLLDLITPQKFREFFLEFRVKKMEEDKDMAW